MAVQIKVKEISPFTVDKAKRSFRRLLKATKDMEPVWKIFLGWYRESFIPDVFKSRGSALGKTWAAYSPAYRIRKRKSNKGKLILSEKLLNAAKGEADSFEKIKKKSLLFGIKDSIEYAAAHQFGSPKQSIPQRPYLFNVKKDLPPRAWAVLVKTMDNFLEGSFNGNK